MHIPLRLAAAGAVLLSLAGCIAYPVPVAYSVTVPSEPPPFATATGYLSTTCGAGFYVCQVPPGPLGSECSCPGIGAPSYGTIR